MPRKVKLSKAEQDVIANGKMIEEVFETKGWKRLLSPLLDEMIESVIGRKFDGKWLQGHMVKSRKDEKKEFYIGYLCALQELSNSIQNYVYSATIVKTRVSDREETRKLPSVIPMVNDHDENENQDFQS